MSKLKQLKNFTVEIDLETLQIDLRELGTFFRQNWNSIKKNIEGCQIHIGATVTVEPEGIIGRIIDTMPLLKCGEIGFCALGSTQLKHFKVIGCGYISVYLYVEIESAVMSAPSYLDKMLPKSVFLHREPVFVVWTISNVCNLSCSHCYYYSDKVDGKPYTKFEDCLAIVDNIAAAGVRCVSLSGGEPLMVPHLGKVIEYCKTKGLRVILNSNLVTMTSAVADMLTEARVDLIVTSLESDRACEHDLMRGIGAFESTTAGIRMCVNAGLNIGVNMAVTKINLNRISQVLNYAYTLGVGFLKYEALIPCGKAEQNYDSLAPSWNEYVKIAEKIDCLAKNEYSEIPIIMSNLFERIANTKKNYCCPSGYLFYTVTHKGDLVICPSLAKAHSGKQNLLQDNFSVFIKKNYEKNDRRHSICKACEYGAVCEGGCFSRSYYSTGNIFSRDPMCAWLETAGGSIDRVP
ncbi:MAG: radical SAM protein [Oscillospiraceae bacterium]|nr:radical SAM protein [Oscillospiraceae bacterium]